MSFQSRLSPCVRDPDRERRRSYGARSCGLSVPVSRGCRRAARGLRDRCGERHGGEPEGRLAMTIVITAFERSPDGGKGLARDTRVRWALEEVGQPYEVRLLEFLAT